jgi:outer membrane lipoprotein SlyB
MHFPAVFFGTLREHYIVLFGAAGGVAIVAGFIGAWIGSHFGARTAARRAVTDAAGELAGKQIQDVMQALDVLTVEVERMSEGHRFISRLLTDQANRDRIALQLPREAIKPGPITPH